ncbi:MAG: zinc-ribbon domain-containing protein, partial [Candidatus Hodarchaeales archaeon]
MDNSDDTKKCPNCGKILPQRANFCTVCGTSLKNGSVPKVITDEPKRKKEDILE